MMLSKSDVVIPIITLEYKGMYAYVQYDLSSNKFFSILPINDEVIILENNSFPNLQKDFHKQINRINEELYEL